MELISKVQGWFNGKGKRLVIIITISIAMIATALNDFLKIPENIVFVFILGILLAYGEMLMGGISDLRSMRLDGLQIDSSRETRKLLQKDVASAKNLILIVRTGESNYYSLSDTFMERGDKLTVKIYFTHTDKISISEEYKMEWFKRWADMFERAQTRFSFEVVDPSFELEAAIVDDEIVYGHYRHVENDSNHFWIRTTTESTHGKFIYNLYTSWVHVAETHNKAALPPGVSEMMAKHS